MTARKYYWVLTLFLIIVVSVSMLNVSAVHADGENPTETPAPTQVEPEPTEPPVETTPVPVEEAEPIAEILEQAPENTEIVVINEEGESVPLASEEAAEIVEVIDPMWCPEGVSPGGAGCTINFPSVTALITDIKTNTGTYAQNGVIYFTSNPGTGLLDLSATNLGSGIFDSINDYNLTLQGGWNGSIVSPSITTQTNFAANPLRIGSSGNPWAGNIILNDIRFSGVSSGNNALNIYTDSGDIVLNNVDVASQSQGGHAALLDTNSGDIVIQSGSSFQSAIVANRGNGVSATSDTGSITITGTSGSNITFNDFRAPGNPYYSGAYLSAPTVSLSYVTASGNDGNGIVISNASLITLNNVTSGPDSDTLGNGRSGVLVNGTPSTIVQVLGGTFADNGRYGIEVIGGSIFMQTNPICPTSGLTANSLGCYSPAPVFDNTEPTITPSVSGTAGLNGWYTSDVSVSWTFNDAESGILSSSGCTASNLTADTAGTALTCSATNKAGLSDSASVTVKIDKTAPVLTLPSDITTTATGSSGAAVTYSASASDNLDASASASCSPASGSTFPLGTTTVSCFSTDEAGNTQLGSFQVTVNEQGVGPTAVPSGTPEPTDPSSSSASSDPDSSTSPSNSSTLIIPLTGGEVIHLDCNSAFWAFGIRLTFTGLCDYQTILNSVEANNLPGALPDGFTFVMGLDLQILSENQAIESLPDGSSILLGFPISGAKEEFAVLHWNGSAWTEVTSQANDIQGFYQVSTTDQTGSFVLVKK